MAIRQPIVATLGHVDHGKTTLLDRIRGSSVAAAEPGLITQSISVTSIPMSSIKSLCGKGIDKVKAQITIPGLLIIDTPGHAAFTTLRKRGGAIADIAMLIIDINEGFKPQTDESVNFLKQFKTPFVVVATKIDRIMGWQVNEGSSFPDTFNEQSSRVQEDLEKKVYTLIGQLSQRGFNAERVDRVADFTKEVAVVPASGKTGEGVPDLLMLLIGMSQRYLKDKLGVGEGYGKGVVLEVKDFKGLGTTVDVILYDGSMGKGDYLIIGGKEPVVTNVKAILQPHPLVDIRAEKDFKNVKDVSAAAGIKVSAPALEDVVAGMPLRTVTRKEDIQKAKKEIEEEVESVEIETQSEGVILKADTLGGLEALIKSLKDVVPIRKASVGAVNKFDVMEARTLEKAVIFAFNIRPPEDIQKLAKDNGVFLLHSDVIYRLIKDFQKWESDSKKREEEKAFAMLPRPASIRVLPGYLFRQKRPAVFGVEVVKGTLKSGARLSKKGKSLGEAKEIQAEGKPVDQAKMGEKVAISMPDVVFGKHVQEGDTLEAVIIPQQLRALQSLRHRLRPDEAEMLDQAASR